MPVNLGTVAQRNAVAGPAGTTNYSAVTAGLPGGTANLLTGTGNHASSDSPFGQQQVGPLDAALAPVTDVYFRGFDQAGGRDQHAL